MGKKIMIAITAAAGIAFVIGATKFFNTTWPAYIITVVSGNLALLGVAGIEYFTEEEEEA